jgi:hypothetical protein
MMLTPGRKPRPAVPPQSPIRWSPDADTVGKVLLYSSSERHTVAANDRHGLARRAILSRIYGNTRNANHPAYSPEVSYDTVVGDLVRSLTYVANTRQIQAERAGLLAALEKEWEIVQWYFLEHFAPKPKPDPDN